MSSEQDSDAMALEHEADSAIEEAIAAPSDARRGLSSVASAMRLLKMFSEGEVEIGVTTLARRLGVAKSTAYRLASTLVAEGMLEQNPETEKYRLGIALFGLGALVRQRMNVSNEARPYLFDLREATNETVHLAILDRASIMYVYDLESTQAIRMRANLGERKPALCTAEGRAMLAFQPREQAKDSDRHRHVARRAEGGADARLRARGRTKRARHALRRRADPRRLGQRGGRRRHGRPRSTPVRRGAGAFRAARRRNGPCHFHAPRI